jgi:hypothetical protein
MDDMDDDNDGILDTDECPITYTQLNWTTLGANAATIATTAGQTFTNIGATLGIPSLNGVDLTLKYVYDGSSSCLPSNLNFFVNNTSATAASESRTGTQFNLYEGTLTATLSAPRMLKWMNMGTGFVPQESLTYGPAADGSITSTHSGTGMVLTDDAISNSTATNCSSITTYGFGVWQTNAAKSQIYFTSNGGQGAVGSLAIGNSYCDTDGDGIVNSLDLDSDNDGCSDAFEAGATTNVAANYQFTGSVGTNGLADAKETAIDNGVVNYTLTYTNAINNTIKACCPTAIITATETSCTANDDKIVSGQSATLTASGGSIYAWSTGETTATINVIPSISTTYTVTVTNASGCAGVVATKTINITTVPIVSITKSSDITCATPNITLNALPSSGATYAWNNGATTQNRIVNAGGSYTVTVTDVSNGCISNANIVVAVDTNLVATLSKNNDIDCNNLTATLTVNSAASPLSYAWLDTTATTSSLVVTTAKAYQVTVTNTATGCFSVTRYDNSH